MKRIRKSTQFKKDVKRFKHQPDKLQKLKEVVILLENDIKIPEEYSPHCLKGKYKGYMECHIQENLLLIWLDEENNTVCLERLGSLSELFD